MQDPDNLEPRPQRPATSSPTPPMVGSPADFDRLRPSPPTDAERAYMGKFITDLLKSNAPQGGGAL